MRDKSKLSEYKNGDLPVGEVHRRQPTLDCREAVQFLAVAPGSQAGCCCCGEIFRFEQLQTNTDKFGITTTSIIQKNNRNC